MGEFIKFCENFSTLITGIAQDVLDYVNTPVLEHLKGGILPEWVLELLPNGIYSYLEEYSILEIMFGTGLTVFITVVMAKFVIDFIRGD